MLGLAKGVFTVDAGVVLTADVAAVHLHSRGAIAQRAAPSLPVWVEVMHAGLQQDLQDARGGLTTTPSTCW